MRPTWALPLAGTLLAALGLASLGLVACQRNADPASPRAAAAAPQGAREPAQAVLLLTRHLRDSDLAAFARDAVPAELHRELEAAWRGGHTRWPLDELPFDERLPKLLGALAEPGADARLQTVFDHQFSGETSALKAAATALGLFGAQYVQHQGDFSAAERAHYLQFVDALSKWGRGAPLGDPGRAREAIPRLTAAARTTGLASEADFARLGMAASLQRLSGFLKTLKAVLAGYGLQLDESLGGLKAEAVSQDGARAKVRMRYTLGGSPVDAVVEVERIAGRWYLSDYLRHARDAVDAAKQAEPAAAAAPAKPAATPKASAPKGG